MTYYEIGQNFFLNISKNVSNIKFKNQYNLKVLKQKENLFKF